SSSVILIARAHPALRVVSRISSDLFIRILALLEALDRVIRQRVKLRLRIDLIQLCRVQAEDVRLILLRQLLVAELLAQLVADLEALHQINRPLRRAPPQAISAPDDVVGTVELDVLADQVLAHQRIINCEEAER